MMECLYQRPSLRKIFGEQGTDDDLKTIFGQIWRGFLLTWFLVNKDDSLFENNFRPTKDRWLAFLLTRGLESWVGNYLEQLDEIPKVKHIIFCKIISFEFQYDDSADIWVSWGHKMCSCCCPSSSARCSPSLLLSGRGEHLPQLFLSRKISKSSTLEILELANQDPGNPGNLANPTSGSGILIQDPANTSVVKGFWLDEGFWLWPIRILAIPLLWNIPKDEYIRLILSGRTASNLSR